VKVAAMPGNGLRTDRMADLQERIQTTEQRITELRADIDNLDAETIAPQELKQALEAFDPIWNTLNSSEQSRIIRALVERVGYDGRTGKLAVTFRSAGFKTLCDAVENNADQQ
jgi:site-specific DNA recombinase